MSVGDTQCQALDPVRPVWMSLRPWVAGQIRSWEVKGHRGAVQLNQVDFWLGQNAVVKSVLCRSSDEGWHVMGPKNCGASVCASRPWLANSLAFLSPTPTLPSVLMSRPHWGLLYHHLSLGLSPHTFKIYPFLSLVLFRTSPETTISFLCSAHGRQYIPTQAQGPNFSFSSPAPDPSTSMCRTSRFWEERLLFENWPQRSLLSLPTVPWAGTSLWCLLQTGRSNLGSREVWGHAIPIPCPVCLGPQALFLHPGVGETGWVEVLSYHVLKALAGVLPLSVVY